MLSGIKDQNSIFILLSIRLFLCGDNQEICEYMSDIQHRLILFCLPVECSA